MSEPPHRPRQRTEFLQRSLYRRKRLFDALKLLPVVGTILFVFPALLLAGEPGTTAVRLVYFFICWVGLISLCALLVRRLPASEEDM
ncbi:MAG: hypothetical protein AAF672_09085 [Pseudomonadota bacterium]